MSLIPVRPLLLCVFCVMGLAPYGAAQAEPAHGVAMHGDLKYAPDFANLGYVNPDAPKGGTLRLHAMGSFDSLNPFILKGTAAAGVGTFVYETLMEQSLDEPFSIYGLLAETIEIAPDRSWVAFVLRPQVRWHDGKPVRAQDVKWTFETLLEKGAPFYRAYYGDVAEVVAESDQRVVFRLSNTSNAELPLILGQMPVLPEHAWTGGQDFAQTSLVPPLGSGPYQVAVAEAGRRIEYVRAANWWGADLPINRGRFNFDRIVYDYYADGNVALEAFLAGRYDVREENVARLWASAYDVPSVRDGRILREEIPHARPQGMQGFVYNLRRPVFADVAVREALAYALDFEWSNRQVAHGAYTRSRSFFENSELAAQEGAPVGREREILDSYKDAIPESLFTARYAPPVTDGSGNIRANLRKASEILDSAGWHMGADKIRTKDGVRLEFEIVDNNPQFERWVLPFIQNLERIGVKAQFRVVDSAQYQNRMQDFDYDMTVLSLPQSPTPGNEQRDYWGSAHADVAGSRNYMGIKDPVIDGLVEKIIHAPTREELIHTTRALDRVLLSHHLVIPHWHIPHWRIARWKKISRPENLSDFSPAVAQTWWMVE